MMKTFEADIVRLEDKLRTLVARLENLTAENTQLQQEIREMKGLAESQKNTIKELQETNKMVKLADGIQTRLADNEDIKSKISGYIKEIDRCIAILGD